MGAAEGDGLASRRGAHAAAIASVAARPPANAAALSTSRREMDRFQSMRSGRRDGPMDPPRAAPRKAGATAPRVAAIDRGSFRGNEARSPLVMLAAGRPERPPRPLVLPPPLAPPSVL